MNYLFYILMPLCILSCSQPPPKAIPPVNVTVFEIEPETLPNNPEFVGVAESSHLVEIRARIEGYLDGIEYVEGSVVEENQLLFKIDQKPFLAALQNAQGELARQEANLWNAKRSVERLKPLFEQKAASRKDYDDATAQEQASIASVESAKASVTQAELNLGYTSIFSPIKGLSSRANFRIGSLITPGQNGLLTNISVINPIWVNFTVSEGEHLKHLSDEKKGIILLPKDGKYEVELILSDGSVFAHRGYVDFADPNYDQQTGTMRIRATVPNPGIVIRPGQFVKVRVIGMTRPNAVIVPQQAVQQGRTSQYVYVINKENKAEVREVKPGSWYKQYWIIREGLKKGDIVIVDGVNKVRDGTQVNITKVEKI